MKKIRRTVMVAIIVMMFLAACGSAGNGRVDSGEIVVPEMSSEELLVSSLEYLLQDDEEPEKSDEEDQESAEGEEENPESETTEDENAGPESSEAQNVETGNEDDDAQEPVQDQEREPGEGEAVIYYGNAGSYELSREIIKLEEKSAEELLNALAKHNIVSLDTKLLSFEEREEDGEKILYLNLTKAINEYLKTMSKEAECIILASVVNTFLENYDADGICIVSDEKALATKNAEYTEVLEKCTPEELLEGITSSQMDDGTEEVQQSKLPGLEEKASDEISDERREE